MNEKKLKIPHPKFNKINFIKKTFLFPPSIIKSMNNIEKITTKNKVKKSSRKMSTFFLKQKISLIITLFLFSNLIFHINSQMIGIDLCYQ